MKDLVIIETERLILRTPFPDEASSVVSYVSANREHLANAGPAYPHDFFTLIFWQRQLQANLDEFQNGRSVRLFVFEKPTVPDQDETGHGHDIIGSVNLGEIVRKAAQFCYLGYGIAEAKQGKGLMSEAVRAAVNYAFNEINLHRIMANYMPTNQRSGKLLERVGFVIEGVARDYLYINGAWQDHVLTSLTNANWRPEF